MSFDLKHIFLHVRESILILSFPFGEGPLWHFLRSYLVELPYVCTSFNSASVLSNRWQRINFELEIGNSDIRLCVYYFK